MRASKRAVVEFWGMIYFFEAIYIIRQIAVQIFATAISKSVDALLNSAYFSFKLANINLIFFVIKST